MRLIDADHLTQIICGATILSDGFKTVFRKLVAGEPTIDRPTRSQFKRMAVQLGYEKVVHCKDCRRGEPNLYLNGGKNEVWCNYYDCPKTAAGFCEKGKRKNDFVDDNKIGERKADENEPLGT